MRNKRTGEALFADIVYAKDLDGNTYEVSFESRGDVNLIALKRGFPKKPKAVTVTLQNVAFRQGNRYAIPITRIADPQRVVWPPSPSVAASVDKVVRISAYGDTGQVMTETVEPLPPMEIDHAYLTALSYSPLELDSSGFPSFRQTAYEKSIDAAKVRVDRIRSVVSNTTFTYKNAKVVLANGKHFVWLPTPQRVGSIAGYTVSMGNHLPYEKEASLAKSSGNDQEIDIRFSDKPVAKTGPFVNIDPELRRITWSGNGLSLDVLSVSPGVEAMGLDSLKLGLVGAKFVGSNPFKTIPARRGSGISAMTTIPELRIRIQATTQAIVSSRVFAATVHHFPTYKAAKLSVQ
jgi:hypothetical protein